MAEILAVCRVEQLLKDAGGIGVTAIDKRPVERRLHVRPLGLYGDVQADRKHHGGATKALYAYAEEDAVFWATELGRDIPPGLFGENLRTSGLDVNGAEIGERGPSATSSWSRSPALGHRARPSSGGCASRSG